MFCVVRTNTLRFCGKFFGKQPVQTWSRSQLRSLRTAVVVKHMEKTFQYQDKLPSLPVPPLAQTCEKYLESVKPLLSMEDFLQTKFLVDEFASGVGKDLQEMLENRGKSMRNWLELWWEEVAYLRSRCPSAPLINVGGPISCTDMWPVQSGVQLKRAAQFTHAFLQVWKELYKEKKPIDRMGTVHFCMFQFMRLFACCKIPGNNKDSLKSFFAPAPNSSPRHILVQGKGRIFSCTVLDENLEPLSPPEIERTAVVVKHMEKTFQYQDKLPSLPVPPLAQTCEKYLESVKPLLSMEDFLQTKFLVDEFASGVGKDLQEMLENRGKSMRNWLELWWEEVAYLRSRCPSAPLINVGGPISCTDMWPVQSGVQLKRAAQFTHAFLQVWKELYKEKKPIDRMGTVHFCMFQFMRLFACCKIPGNNKDSLKSFFAPAPNSSPRHILVQGKGRIFSCTVLDENLEPLSPPEIERTAVVVKHMEKTFQYQDKLPSLPVPPLAQTCEKYLESVKPLLSMEDFLQTKFLVDEFASGVGKDLQEMLENRGKSMRNWLELWWEEVAYLRSRCPSAPLINVGGPISCTDMWPVQSGVQLKRAAQFTHAFLQVWKELYKEKKPIDRMGTVHFCMFQFMRLFACCKIPGNNKDSLKSFFAPAPNSSPRHILVQGKGRIFSCTVLDENLEPLSPPEIERQLQQIHYVIDSSPPGPGLGSLTGSERTTWYKLRERLLNLDSNNRTNLDLIEKSLFALVLDENNPLTDSEVCAQGICGNCRDRWFDKSLHIIVFKSGTMASHSDHAPFDAIIKINSIISALNILRESNGEWKGGQEVKNYFEPHELVFKTDDVINESINESIQQYEQTADTVKITAYHYEDYGKGFTKLHKIHPDTYVQLALQLAYYRLHNKPAPTYETAQTRQFYHGRTETVRSCTEEGIAWCKAMLDGRTENSKKVQLFREAQMKHDKLMKEASNGHGIDRHLLGLKLIAAEQGLSTPAIFLDKAWTASGGDANFVLSTSCVGFSNIIGGCAAMVKDGYGAYYSVEESKINFVIATFTTSDVTDHTKFENSLADSFRDMRQILLNARL